MKRRSAGRACPCAFCKAEAGGNVVVDPGAPKVLLKPPEKPATGAVSALEVRGRLIRREDGFGVPIQVTITESLATAVAYDVSRGHYDEVVFRMGGLEYRSRFETVTVRSDSRVDVEFIPRRAVA